ncbi:hypothetical protein ACHAWO_008414 [Cyclotella atomus]|uniref:Uncharacterized protein n=1 Tax=Cyclotella atomus TaxID=382360 RepID=A0ABD3PXA3_9STRA
MLKASTIEVQNAILRYCSWCISASQDTRNVVLSGIMQVDMKVTSAIGSIDSARNLWQVQMKIKTHSIAFNIFNEQIKDQAIHFLIRDQWYFERNLSTSLLQKLLNHELHLRRAIRTSIIGHGLERCYSSI